MIYINREEVKIAGNLIELAAEANILCGRIKEAMVRNGMSEEEAEREIVAVVKLSFVLDELLDEATCQAPMKSNTLFSSLLDHIEHLKEKEKTDEHD